MLPILTGYFNKIVQSQIAKNKHPTLEYLLLFKKGAIFDVLLKHMHHYSLAVLMIELLEVQISGDQKDKQGMAY